MDRLEKYFLDLGFFFSSHPVHLFYSSLMEMTFQTLKEKCFPIEL